jgi:light-regulated signal transduction histidine kinase (bacteriophytochrome)
MPKYRVIIENGTDSMREYSQVIVQDMPLDDHELAQIVSEVLSRRTHIVRDSIVSDADELPPSYRDDRNPWVAINLYVQVEELGLDS